MKSYRELTEASMPRSLNVGTKFKAGDGTEIEVKNIWVITGAKAIPWVRYSFKTPDGKKGEENNPLKFFTKEFMDTKAAL